MLFMLVLMGITRLHPGLASGGGAPQTSTAVGGGNGLLEKEAGRHCWYPLMGVKGCLIAVLRILMHGRTGLIAPACCKEIGRVEDKCWSLTFHFDPIQFLILKGCSSSTTAAAPSQIQQVI